MCFSVLSGVVRNALWVDGWESKSHVEAYMFRRIQRVEGVRTWKLEKKLAEDVMRSREVLPAQ